MFIVQKHRLLKFILHNPFYSLEDMLLYILDIDAIIGLDPAGPIFETNSIGKWFQNTIVVLQKVYCSQNKSG